MAPSDDLTRVARSVAQKLGFTVSKREKLVPYTRYVAFLDRLRAKNPAKNNTKAKPLREAYTALNAELDRLRTVFFDVGFSGWACSLSTPIFHM